MVMSLQKSAIVLESEIGDVAFWANNDDRGEAVPTRGTVRNGYSTRVIKVDIRPVRAVA